MNAIERPVLVQCSPAPALIGCGDAKLLCKSCGHVLVDGFDPKSLIAINIECFGCHEVTTTPEWPDSDEPLPQTVVSIGDRGRFLLGSSVSLGPKASLTCDQELQRLRARRDLIRAPDQSLDLSTEGLQAFVAMVDVMANHGLSKEIGKAQRGFNLRPQLALDSSLAWAVTLLQNQLQRGHINLAEKDGVALEFIHIANHVLRRWANHPLAIEFARGLVENFHHNATMLMAAAYFEEHGNRIGFTDVRKMEGKSPDLYINLNRAEQVSIEVKAPRELQWPNLPTSATVGKVVFTQVKQAKKQIIGSAGGIVVIGSSAVHRRLHRAVDELANRAKFSTKVAAIATVTYPTRGQFQEAGPGTLIVNAEVLVRPVLNPRFQRECFLRI